MTAEQYKEYRTSPEWQARRRAALKRARYRCQLCNGISALDVHHRTYARIGHEDPEDLTVLCRTCHAIFHGYGRLPEYEPELVIQTAWGVVPKQFVGTDNERWRILETLCGCGLRTAVVVEMTGYDPRLVLGTLYVLRGDGLVEKGPKRRWWITDAGRLALMDLSAVGQG